MKKREQHYLTSLPTVMLAITFFTASFLRSFLSLFSSAFNSKISPKDKKLIKTLKKRNTAAAASQK